MADGKGVFANEDQFADSKYHGQLSESLNPPRGQQSKGENGSDNVVNGDVQLAGRGNQGQQSQGPFAEQAGEQGDGSEEFALETGQHAVLFGNPHGVEADRETVLCEVSLFSVRRDDVVHTKIRAIYLH